MRKKALMGVLTALLVSCGGGGGGSDSGQDGWIDNPPVDTVPQKVTVSGFVSGISNAAYVSPVTVRNGIPFRSDAVPVGAFGNYSVKVYPGDYTFIVMDSNGNVLGALKDGSGNPLVVKINSDTSLDLSFTDTDGDGFYEGTPSGSVQTTTSIVAQLKTDLDRDGKWDYLEVVDGEGIIVDVVELWKAGAPELQTPGVTYVDADGDGIPNVGGLNYRYGGGGAFSFITYPGEDGKDGFFASTIQPDGLGCPGSLGPVFPLRMPVYIFKTQYLTDENIDSFIENTERAIQEWNSVVREVYPEWPGFVFYGVLPDLFGEYCLDNSLPSRGVVFVNPVEFRDEYVGYTSSCNTVFENIYLPFMGSSREFSVGGSVHVNIDYSRGNYLSNFIHEFGHIIGLGHPFDMGECDTPSVMNYSTNGCNKTHYISDADKDVVHFFYRLMKKYSYPVVIREDQIQLYYQNSPYCQ